MHVRWDFTMNWKCKSKTITYGEKILIMGIVNVTPDSFSDGGKWLDGEAAVQHALELEKQGADILDLGAQSTRPGYKEISAEEEWSRLESVLPALRQKTDLPVSVDTYFPYVAERAIANGADIVNDISGIINPDMARIVKKTGAGWIIMHNGAGASEDVKAFFEKALRECEALGINKNQLCFDMGIGFGKDIEENLDLIANVPHYKPDGFPLLLGTSRKRVIGAASQQPVVQERVYGNIAADTAAVFGGVDIIRIHDVKNEKQGILMAQELKKWIR